MESAHPADHEIHDDMPVTYERVLLHAPATSHGSYLDGVNEGLKPLEEYQEGEYHPVHLGDTLGASGRHCVIHKLGHGRCANVWLCQELRGPVYVAVKVVAGDVDQEALPELSLTQPDLSSPGAGHIVIPLDFFSITGSNGLHQYFRSANVLVKLAGLEQLSEDEMLSILGHPEKTHVRTESGQDLLESSPHYLVIPADISRLIDKFITDQICVIDFGEAFRTSLPPDNLGVPENYLPPEVLFDEEKAFSQACDIWVLGCNLFEIREQIALFYMMFDEDELLSEIVEFLGKPPKE